MLLGLGPGAAIGVGRFGYSLLLPVMQAELDLTLGQAGLLGSANTAGYLLGAVVSHKVLALFGYRRAFYLALLLQTLTLLLMGAAFPLPALVFLRALQGVLGAFVFVGGAALLLASGGRAGALGAFFGGMGAGIALSVLVVPVLSSAAAGWLLLGGLSALLSALSLLAARDLREPVPPTRGSGGSLTPITLSLVAYGLYGAGYIGYMTFSTSGVGGALTPFWFVLGVATLFNGLAWGRLISRHGGAAGIRLSLVLLTVASLAPLLTRWPLLSAILFGLSFLGVITAITDLFRVHLEPGAWPRAMALSTAVFGIGQAVGPAAVGVAGDLLGGVSGSLWASTALLAAALLVSLGPPGLSKAR